MSLTLYHSVESTCSQKVRFVLSGAGNSVALFPAISGQHAEYTKIQLLAFRDNKRTNDTNKTMQIVSEKMTTEEIDAVANYIQGLH